MEAIAIDLSSKENIAENLIGTEVRFSLKPFIRYIEEKSRADTSSKASIYRYVLNRFYKYPELEAPIALEDASRYKELFELVYTCLSPLLSDEEQQLWALGTPLSAHVYFGTPAFYNIILDPVTQKLKAGLNLATPDEMARNLRTSFYNLVLRKFYNFTLTDQQFTINSTIDPDTHLLRYYQMNIDTRFIEIYNHGDLPELKLHNLKSRLADKSNTLALLTRLLPVTQFSIEGITIVNLVEVTAEYALESIKNVIIEHNECTTLSYNDKISIALKTIVGTDNLEFGLIPYLRINNKTVVNAKTGFKSILLQHAKKQNSADYQQLLDEYLKAPRKLIFPEILPEEKDKYPMIKVLFASGIKSYALLPLYYSGKLVGCLEVYTRSAGLFTTHTLSKLEPAFSLLAQLFQNVIADFNNQISHIITDKFTSIQPAVQWRFYEAAYHFMIKEGRDEDVKLEAISFKGVQPFYAAIDVKDSSVQRNLAIRKDLNLHFELLENTLNSILGQSVAGLKEHWPSDSLICQYKEHKELSDAEILKIEDYLLRQLPPFLEGLKESHPELCGTVANYLELTGAGGFVYSNRLQYEKSMQTVNWKINSMLVDFNVTLQEIYPCYFEKFRTDGVEFDIYLGQSIAPELPMPANLVEEFRLRHLRAVAQIAIAAHGLIPALSDYLQTTQLIFVHEKAIDISFRPDEQRFDVEGGYNIRYQLVKKRIDKAHIRDSDERLTQPGKIAIVYLNSWEAQDYLSYIRILQGEGILNDDVEYIEIEELQGVDGLKALRVGIKFDEMVNQEVL
jgi:hypothetical protein